MTAPWPAGVKEIIGWAAGSVSLRLQQLNSVASIAPPTLRERCHRASRVHLGFEDLIEPSLLDVTRVTPTRIRGATKPNSSTHAIGIANKTPTRVARFRTS